MRLRYGARTMTDQERWFDAGREAWATRQGFDSDDFGPGALRNANDASAGWRRFHGPDADRHASRDRAAHRT
jgi:hypothetical protein